MEGFFIFYKEVVSVVTLKCKASIIAFSNTLKINFIYLFIFTGNFSPPLPLSIGLPEITL